MWGRGFSLNTSVGAGAGAASPSVFVSSSIMVAVASLVLSWVGAILLAVFVFALCCGLAKSGFGRPPVAQICRTAAAGLWLCFEIGQLPLRFSYAAAGGAGRRSITLVLLLVSYKTLAHAFLRWFLLGVFRDS